MSVQEGIYYLGGTAILGVGLYLTFGLGPALTAVGALLVFVAIIGEFPETESADSGKSRVSETPAEDQR